MTLRAKLSLDGFCKVNYTDSTGRPEYMGRLGTTLFPKWTLSLTDGSTANKALYQYLKKQTLAAAGTLTLDLTALVTERFGTVTFTKIRLFWIRLRTPAASTKITVGNAASDIWSPFLSASTCTFDCADSNKFTNPVDGWTVDATHKNLKFTNPSAGSVDFDTWLIGY